MTRFLEPDARVRRSRDQWKHRGAVRPEFARVPAAGQESVWDYPRPPRLMSDGRAIEVRHGDVVLAATRGAIRVLETASPPTFYLPPEDVDTARLSESGGQSFCEWKGLAVDLDLTGLVRSVGWRYLRVYPEFETIAGWVAFYPGRISCFVDGERVRPQPGGYYGGWITDEIVGPVKGEPGYDGL